MKVEKHAHDKGNPAEAEGAHEMQFWLLRAWAAERDDPKPDPRG